MASASAAASRRHLAALLLVTLSAVSTAGPLGPLPNVTVTSADLGLKQGGGGGGCAVGDVVYLPGEEFPGASACERCRCAGGAGGAVTCARAVCEPRPGCKALHRPDHCCPTYQCECEQEGRVYGNGEKLVDPLDPCRVCYCQGGEVVCRRIACFRRDDCVPRAVPGRCCPEYDNCPLRGVTATPGIAPSMPTAEEATSPAPTLQRENIKQEITIKEITPVSEIPVLPDVRVKEILPTPGLEVPNYPSSKSPLIVREATSERVVVATPQLKADTPVVVEVHTLSSEPQPPRPVSSEAPTILSDQVTKETNDLPPSKISFSTQDLINSDVYAAAQPSAATLGVTAATPGVEGSSRAPAQVQAQAEEEESPPFEHNPAFPPLPDDLSVAGNHEDELLPDQLEGDHGAHEYPERATGTPATPATPAIAAGASASGSASETPRTEETTQRTAEFVTIQTQEISTHSNSINDLSTSNNIIISASSTAATETSTAREESTFSTENTKVKDSPMLNLRSAIPTDILNMPSSVPEEITGELDEEVETSPFATETSTIATSSATEKPVITKEQPTEISTPPKTIPSTTTSSTVAPLTTDIGTSSVTESNSAPFASSAPSAPSATSAPVTRDRDRDRDTNRTPGPETKSSIVTEITAHTEFSSLPIETSDQNPRENSEIIEKEKSLTSTPGSAPTEFATTKLSSPVTSEVITVSRPAPTSTENQSAENIETTEFIISTIGSSESAIETDNFEFIKISGEPDQNAAIMDADHGKKNNVLTDLIDLVGDVASIGDHTDPPSSPVDISESEELLPINAGYKSKNNNWNQNSITEVPVKRKSVTTGNKYKVVEIEDDNESITDAPAPHDRIEPTTRRPIIDSVDDTKQNNHTDKKDIEIITRSYVPTISRRPTKVIMKKNNERPQAEDATEAAIQTPTSATGGASAESASAGTAPAITSAGTPARAPLQTTPPGTIQTTAPAALQTTPPAPVQTTPPAPVQSTAAAAGQTTPTAPAAFDRLTTSPGDAAVSTTTLDH